MARLPGYRVSGREGPRCRSAWEGVPGAVPAAAGKTQVRPQQVGARQRIPWRHMHALLCPGAAVHLLLAGDVLGCHGKVRPTGSARWHSCDGVGSLLAHARDVVSTSHCGIAWTCRSSRSPALQGSKARVRPRGTAGCPSVLVTGCPQGNLGRAPVGGGLAESGAVAEGFTSCSECWYGFGAPLWDRAGDPGPRDPVPPVPWGCRCLHRTRSGGLTTLPPPGRFAKPPRTLGVWFPRGQWGGSPPCARRSWLVMMTPKPCSVFTRGVRTLVPRLTHALTLPVSDVFGLNHYAIGP